MCVEEGELTTAAAYCRCQISHKHAAHLVNEAIRNVKHYVKMPLL